MINFKAFSWWLAPLGLLLFSIPAAGQIPDKFTNLQVLPRHF